MEQFRTQGNMGLNFDLPQAHSVTLDKSLRSEFIARNSCYLTGSPRDRSTV